MEHHGGGANVLGAKLQLPDRNKAHQAELRSVSVVAGGCHLFLAVEMLPVYLVVSSDSDL